MRRAKRVVKRAEKTKSMKKRKKRRKRGIAKQTLRPKRSKYSIANI